MTRNEMDAFEAMELLVDRHPEGWVGVDRHRGLLAIGAVGHAPTRLWRSAEELARDVSQRLRRGGMGPLAFAWRGDNWCVLATPASPPVPTSRIVAQVHDMIRLKQHDEAGRGPGPGLRSDPSIVDLVRPRCEGARGERMPRVATGADLARARED